MWSVDRVKITYRANGEFALSIMNSPDGIKSVAWTIVRKAEFA